MPYIGNEAADRFVSQPAVDQFSGDGSTTAFTLSFPVSSDQDILVSVDGVVQDTAAYAVSSGTTLTFTAAPSSNSGNNIFVNYLARTHATVAHPATSALTATTGTFTSNVGIGNARTEGTLHVQTASAGTVTASTQADDLVVENSSEGGITIITPDDESARIRFTSPSTNTDVGGASIFYRQNINKMNVGTSVSGGKLDLLSGEGASAILADGDGNVTMAKQPSFLVKPTNAQNNVGITDGSAVVVTFDNEIYDVGANFASNAFTAPVTGKYYLSASLYMLNIDSAAVYIGMYIYTSNRYYFQLIDPDFGQDAVYWTFTHSVVADMDANDTVNVRFAQYSGTIQADIQTESTFMGHLLG